MNQLTRELEAMLATIPITNGGDDHRHIGMILHKAKYIAFSTSTAPLVAPKNPVPYPTTISTNEVDCLHKLAKHKQIIIEYETYHGCLQATRFKIIHAIDPKWLAGLCSQLLSFMH
jgi:hypothetical protein